MERIFKIRCSAIGKIMGASKPAGGLSVTAQTYLKEWYSNDNEQIHSKYFDKGNIMENDCIDFAQQVLGMGTMMKYAGDALSNEYITGTADVVLSNSIIDVKCPWNRKSLLDSMGGIDEGYEWQGRGYMSLYGKEKFILFYGLMDTPADVCYQEEDISYSHLPDNERWLAYEVQHDQSKVDAIIAQVIKCRDYLAEYDKFVKVRIGKIF